MLKASQILFLLQAQATPSSSPAVFLESGNSIPPKLTSSDNTIRKRKEAGDQEFSFDFLHDSDLDKTLTAGKIK